MRCVAITLEHKRCKNPAQHNKKLCYLHAKKHCPPLSEKLVRNYNTIVELFNRVQKMPWNPRDAQELALWKSDLDDSFYSGDYMDVERDFENFRSQLSKRLSDARQHISVDSTKNNHLLRRIGELEALLKSCEDLKAELQIKSNKITLQSQEIGKLEADLQVKNETIAELERSRPNLDNLTDDMKENIAKLEARISRINGDLLDRAKQLGQKDSEIADLKKRLKKCEGEAKTLTFQQTMERNRGKSQDSRYNELRDEYQKVKNELANSKKDFIRKVQEFNMLKETVRKLVKVRYDLEAKLKKCPSEAEFNNRLKVLKNRDELNSTYIKKLEGEAVTRERDLRVALDNHRDMMVELGFILQTNNNAQAVIEESKRLQEQLRTTSQALEDQKTDLEQSQTALARANLEIQSCQRQLEDMKAAQEVENLREQLHSLSIENKELNDERQRSLDEFNNLEREKAEVQAWYAEATKRLTSVSKSARALKREKKELENQLVELKQNPQVKEENLDLIRELEAKNQALEENIEESEKARIEIVNFSAEQKAELSRLIGEAVSLKQQVKSFDEQADLIKRDNERLRKELEDLQANQSVKQEGDVVELKDQIRELETEKQVWEQQRDRLKQTVRQQKIDLGAAQAKHEQDLRDSRKKERECEDRNTKLKAANANLVSTNLDLARENKELEEERNDFEFKSKKCQSDLDKAQSRATSGNKELEDKLRECEADNQEKAENIEAAIEAANELNSKLTNLEAQNESLKQQRADLEANIEELKDSYAQFTSTAATKAQSNQEQFNDLADAKDELKAKYEKLKEKYAKAENLCSDCISRTKQLAAEKKKLIEQRDKYMDDIVTLTSTIRSMKDNKNSSSSAREDVLYRELTEAKQKLNANKTQIAALQRQLQKLGDKEQELQGVIAALDAMKNNLDQTRASLEKSKEREQKCQSDLKLSDANERARLELIENEQKAHDETRERLRKCGENAQQLKIENENFRKQLEELRRQPISGNVQNFTAQINREAPAAMLPEDEPSLVPPQQEQKRRAAPQPRTYEGALRRIANLVNTGYNYNDAYATVIGVGTSTTLNANNIQRFVKRRYPEEQKIPAPASSSKSRIPALRPVQPQAQTLRQQIKNEGKTFGNYNLAWQNVVGTPAPETMTTLNDVDRELKKIGKK